MDQGEDVFVSVGELERVEMDTHLQQHIHTKHAPYSSFFFLSFFILNLFLCKDEMKNKEKLD